MGNSPHRAVPPTPDARVLRTGHDVLRAAIDVLVEEAGTR
jgi:hypothetical protein